MRRVGRRRGGAGRVSRRTSLLGARAAAIVIDGLALVVPGFGMPYVLSLVFPNHGFFFYETSSAAGSASVGLRLGLPGVLVISAVSLSYFFLLEALRGQTIGKRAMGLRVESAGGGRAGLNSISARTVLRLIDGQVLYLVGLLVAVLTGSRRRRLGDWLGGTVVVRDDATREDVPVLDVAQRPLWQVLAYPLSWIAAVLVATFALGLGTAAGADEQAISLVRSYIHAREQGNGALACSMLTSQQQREIVAIQTRDYREADVARCPAMILKNEPGSHLLNPNLDAFAAGPLTARYSSAGVAQVLSRSVPGLELIVVLRAGQAKLDVRGVQRLGFIRGCDAAGVVSSTQCDCVFDTLRADGLLGAALEGKLTPAITAEARRCRSA